MHDVEIVVSTDSGNFKGMLTPLVQGLTPTQTIYHHNLTLATTKAGYVGPIPGREASVFFHHATQRYDSLAEKTAFVHEDAWIHNPVWPHWIGCLRDNATHASLSPLWRPHAPGPTGSLARTLGARPDEWARQVPWSCCFLLVQGRELMRTIPRAAYAAAGADIARGRDAQGSAVSGSHLENAVHVLRQLPANWLQPCQSYRCEEARCARLVRFVRAPSQHITHGVPISAHSASLHAWQEQACGVRHPSQPEALQLASVRETVPMPCSAGALGLRGASGVMRTVDEVHNRTGCVAGRGRRGWMNAATTEYAQGLRKLSDRSVPSAKVAVIALKGGMCTALVRCWQACCAECARRANWCRAWAWTLSRATCALSDAAPIAAAAPSFDRVVGTGGLES